MGSGFQVEDEFLEDDWDFDDEDSEIDGDCKESQPCRGDEPRAERRVATIPLARRESPPLCGWLPYIKDEVLFCPMLASRYACNSHPSKRSVLQY